MTFSVTILGSISASPLSGRHTSSQLINIQESLFMIDCGEATQMQLRRYNIKLQKINHIFISHLHGDHYLGLIGLLFTYHLLNRSNDLHIYAPEELENIINLQLEAAKCELVYNLIFHKTDNCKKSIIFEDENLSVETIPLLHRIPTTGFLFREKIKPRNIKKDILTKINIPFTEFDKIKNGEDFISADGVIYKNAYLTSDPPVPRSYAYCSDTGYNEKMVKQVSGVDLLYHETTFKQDKKILAFEKMHSTTIDASSIAQKAKVKKLIIGHFSARYENDELDSFLDEAKTIFPQTYLALEGNKFEL